MYGADEKQVYASLFSPVIHIVKMVKNAASERLNWVGSLQGQIVRKDLPDV